MTLNKRETILAVITLFAVLAGGTYWLLEPRLEAWQSANEEVDYLMARHAASQRLIAQRGDLDQRLNVLRERLPQYPVGMDVITSQLLRNLQGFADEHGLTLIRREPEPEREIGDLFEAAITCTWEGELNALVRFLYALQAQGAIVDIRQLTITPVQGAPNRLRGNFTVDYAYSRVESTE
jgi:Tfp pilus assembly protein PilO